jgi:hypothetical protein
MSLNAKQARFTYCIAQLIVWAKEELGVDLIGAELYRTPEQAEIYFKQGKGIKNSVHRKKLALDMYVLKDGKIVWDGPEYDQIAVKWRSLDPDARWGGDFRRRDVYHYSFMHRGVM